MQYSTVIIGYSLVFILPLSDKMKGEQCTVNQRKQSKGLV